MCFKMFSMCKVNQTVVMVVYPMCWIQLICLDWTLSNCRPQPNSCRDNIWLAATNNMTCGANGCWFLLLRVYGNWVNILYIHVHTCYMTKC